MVTKRHAAYGGDITLPGTPVPGEIRYEAGQFLHQIEFGETIVSRRDDSYVYDPDWQVPRGEISNRFVKTHRPRGFGDFNASWETIR